VLGSLSKVLTDDDRVKTTVPETRDSALERQVSALLHRLFPDAEHFPQCYESCRTAVRARPRCDLGTLHVCVRVESQSSAGAFQGSGQGIRAHPPDLQSRYWAFKAAFDQSKRMRQTYLKGKQIQLYTQQGELIRE